MQQIVEYNERLAYVTVEPGVTVRQLYHFLEEHHSPHFVSVVGGPMDTSLIGNAIERGLGTGRAKMPANLGAWRLTGRGSRGMSGQWGQVCWQFSTVIAREDISPPEAAEKNVFHMI